MQVSSTIHRFFDPLPAFGFQPAAEQFSSGADPDPLRSLVVGNLAQRLARRLELNAMQRRHSQKRVKLALISLVAGITGWCLPSQGLSSGTFQQEDRSHFEIVGQDTPTADRFGTADGAAFVLHFTGDIHGSLEPCG